MVAALHRCYGSGIDKFGTEYVREGAIFKHFKGGIYKIIGIGRNSEDTEQIMVMYSTLEDADGNPPRNLNYMTWVRPFDMFVSEVDRFKYPDTKQKYRFEMIVDEVDGDTYSDIFGWNKEKEEL